MDIHHVNIFQAKAKASVRTLEPEPLYTGLSTVGLGGGQHWTLNTKAPAGREWLKNSTVGVWAVRTHDVLYRQPRKSEKGRKYN